MSIVLGYNVDMLFPHFSSKIGCQLLIILALLSVIFLPRPILGWWYLEKAIESDSIGDHFRAEFYFENAALRCWWENGLYEKAANSSISVGDNKDAIRLFQRALKEKDLSDKGLLLLGELFLQMDDIDSAYRVWDLISLDSESASSGFFNKASYQQENGQFSAAMDNWRKGLKISPYNGLAHFNLGMLLMASDPDEAPYEFEQAGLYEQSLAVQGSIYIVNIQKALKVDDIAYQLVFSGKVLAEMDEWKLADLAFHNSTIQNPYYAEAWAWLGESAQHLDKDPLPALQKSLELDPQSITSLVLTGLYHRRQGQIDQSWDFYSQAAKLEPDNIAWKIVLGELSAEKGNLADAFEYLSEGVRLSPSDPESWRALLQFSVKYQIYLDTIGLDAARKLLQLEPTSWQSFDGMGQIMMASNILDRAEYYFQRSIELDPNQAESHVHLGSLFLLLNRFVQAQVEFETAYSLAPDSAAGQQAKRLLDQYFP